MEIYYQNCRGLKSKLLDLKLNLLANNYDIICLTETWLNDSIIDAELIDDRYYVIRKDRDLVLTDTSDGGGSLIAIKRSFVISVIPSLNSIFDDVWLKINLHNGMVLILCVVYFPPKRTIYEHYKKFCDHIADNILNLAAANHNFLVIGDFNLPCITWSSSHDGLYPASYEGRSALYLVETITLTKLLQHNNIVNCSDNVLDLVFSNLKASSIEVTQCSDPLSKVDHFHPPIHINLLNFGRKQLSYKSFNSINFKQLNYSHIREQLMNVNWDIEFNNSKIDVDTAVNILYSKLNHFLEPKLYKNKPQSKFPVWYSSQLRHLINRKLKYHKLYKIYKNQHDYKIFSELRRQVKLEIRICYNKYLRSIEHQLKQNPNLFWSFSHSLSSQTSFPATMRLGTTESHNCDVICNLFADYFDSVFMARCNSVSLLSDTRTRLKFYGDLNYITTDDVYRVLTSLDVRKGSGPDYISNYFIYQLKDELAKPLSIIFNLSLNSGIFPSVWKRAFLVPIFKKGDKSDIENYRPISILNAFSKIFEKLVHSLLFHVVNKNISNLQHGFFAKRSVLTNLLEFSNYIFGSVDNGLQVDCIYTDFQKAFDSVAHDILIDKCSKIGLSAQICKWLSSYLHDRPLNVKFNGYLSKPFFATSGVPQGSTLGPLLFIIFINDLSNILECPHLFYADDLKIFNTINSLSDALKLQADIYKLQSWCIKNKLNLNINKCVTITFTKKIDPFVYSYNIGGLTLNKVSHISDLGVTFDSKLSFNKHIEVICIKANKILGFIFRRGREFRDSNVLTILFNCLVRSLLEYASPIWNPFYDKYSDQIERVQKRFTRFLFFKSIPYIGHISYNMRLNILNLLSLDNRRLMLDDVLLYKIVNFKVETTMLSEVRLYTPAYNTRTGQLFLPKHSRTNLGFANPLSRIQHSHNDLFDSLDLFALSLRQYKLCLVDSIK